MTGTKGPVLLVDDARTILELERSVLEPAGYELHMASSAEDARGILATLQPRVIVLDVMMPGISGIDFCRELRESERFRSVAILMVTSQAEEEWVEAAYRAGCTDYLTKPIERAELLAKVAQYAGSDG
jgi:CheY-like chemotaxis protein